MKLIPKRKTRWIRSRKHRAMLLVLGVMAPLSAFPLDLSDYLNESSVTASSSQFESNVLNNTSTVQITPNAEIILVKQVLNDNGGNAVLGDFSIATSAGTPVFDAGVTVGTTTTYTAATLYVAPGTYTLSEADVDGYTEGTWACDVGTMGTTDFDGGEVTLAFGEQTTCTIANDDIAPTLVLAKTVTNNNGGDKTVADFDISVDGTEVINNMISTVAANTAITVSELSLPGYTSETWSCVDANSLTSGLPTAGAAGSTSLTLNEGSAVTCSITNDDVGPQLTLSKVLVNDNGGTAVATDFNIAYSIGGVSTTPTLDIADSVTANAVITISESDLAAYAEGTWECVDANTLTTGLPTTGLATGTDITLLPGSDVTCTITNNDLGIDLTIAKVVDDSTPNIGQEITFTLTVSNAGPDDATDVTVNDIVPAGFTYVAASITGGDAQDDTDPTGTGGLSWTVNALAVGTPAVLQFKATVNAP